MVHIDLGIAFEQGRFLATPERVPFRLTANIVDGMGAAGVEGTFRRCCETVVQVRACGGGARPTANPPLQPTPRADANPPPLLLLLLAGRPSTDTPPLQVLRDNQEALLTVVQVVLHDPMYSWQMNPVKAGRKQQDALGDEDAADGGGHTHGTAPAGGGGAAGTAAHGLGSSGVGAAAVATAGTASTSAGRASITGGTAAVGALGNADAERAVLRVKQKLQGQDVDGGAILSVAAYVGSLIQAAQDPENLCRLFVGWAAWT